MFTNTLPLQLEWQQQQDSFSNDTCKNRMYSVLLFDLQVLIWKMLRRFNLYIQGSTIKNLACHRKDYPDKGNTVILVVLHGVRPLIPTDTSPWQGIVLFIWGFEGQMCWFGFFVVVVLGSFSFHSDIHLYVYKYLCLRDKSRNHLRKDYKPSYIGVIYKDVWFPWWTVKDYEDSWSFLVFCLVLHEVLVKRATAKTVAGCGCCCCGPP